MPQYAMYGQGRNQVGYTGIAFAKPVQTSKFYGAMSQTFLDYQNTYLKQAKQNFDLTVDNTVKTEIARIKQAHPADPEGLGVALKAYKEKFVSNLDLDKDLADEISLKFDIQAAPAINEALKIKRGNLDSQLEVAARQNAETSQQMLFQTAGSLFNRNSFDEVQVDFDNANAQMLSIVSSVKAQKSDGSFVFSPKEQADLIKSTTDGMFFYGVKSWFENQPDQIKALDDWESGKVTMFMADAAGVPTNLNVREAATPELRDKITKELASVVAAKARAVNEVEKQREREVKKVNNQRARQLFLSDDIVERQRLYSQLINSPDTTAEQARSYQEYLRGQREVDDASQLYQLEYDIQAGRIRSVNDAVLYRGISENTLRTRVIPLIERQQDESFKRAQDYIKNTLGLPSGAIVLGGEGQQIQKRVGEATAELILAREKDPSADYFDLAKNIVGKYKEQSEIEKMSQTKAAIERLEIQRDAFLKKGDEVKANGIQQQIDRLRGNNVGQL